MTTGFNRQPALRSLAASWHGLRILIGFQKGYNFVLWCIFALGLLGFTLGRAPYLDYYGVFCKPKSLTPGFHAAPGECYFFLNGRQEQIGMMMHLYGIIPCCLLLFFQFMPVVRQKAVMFHRINGYIVIVMMAVALVGGLMVTRNSFGGDVSFQVANVLLGVSVTMCLALAMVNVKRLQIDQHRAWMLRAWVLVRHWHLPWCPNLGLYELGQFGLRTVVTDDSNRPRASSQCASSRISPAAQSAAKNMQPCDHAPRSTATASCPGP